MKSLIELRVEKLYGPEALSKGFLMQKRTIKVEDNNQPLEKPLRSQSYCDAPRKSKNPDFSSTSKDTSASLPVLRHLSPEFRAQLSILSPRKSSKTNIPQKSVILIDKISHGSVAKSTCANTEKSSIAEKPSLKIDSDLLDVSESDSTDTLTEQVDENTSVENAEVVQDANYFFALEKKEAKRLIALAETAEKELETLQDNAEVSEEVFGLLRAASGKARLLATQKMKQFEGLCYNNINQKFDEPFPTTLQDLQGFWDMVSLQVNHVETLFAQLSQLKENNWQEVTITAPETTTRPVASTTTRHSRISPGVKNEKARLAAEKREQERKAMLEHRRRLAWERQLAARATPGTSRERDHDMGIEGSQEVEIFIGKSAKPSKVAPQGDCVSKQSSHSVKLS